MTTHYHLQKFYYGVECLDNLSEINPPFLNLRISHYRCCFHTHLHQQNQNSTERSKLLTTLHWKIPCNYATKNQSVWVVSLLYAYHLLVHIPDFIKILNNISPVLWSSRSFYKVSKWFPYSITYLINNSVIKDFPILYR